MTADTALHPANPQQLTELYGQFPSYDRLRIRSVNVSPFGPTLTLRADPQFVVRHISAFRAAGDEPEHAYLSRLDTKLHGTSEPATTTETFYAR